MRNLIVSFFVVSLLLINPSGASASNDPEFNRQYGVTQISAPSAWTKTRADNVTIAVVDSGVDVEHPDLAKKLVKGYDFADDDNNPDDDSELKDGNDVSVKSHGTHVAGLAAAITDNGEGVAGVAANAKIMPLKVFSSGGGGVVGFAAVPQAIRYAVDNGAKVINLSLGTFEAPVPLLGFTQTPCAEALQRGVLCVVASGNSGGANASGYPKDYPGLIVTANDEAGKHSGFGQKADTQWSVSAPGVANLSTVPVEMGSYGKKQGTSMAAPHAAGVAALVYAELNPPPTAAGAQMVINRILTTARPMGDPGTNGAGRIDAAAAVGAKVEEAPATTAPASGSAAPESFNEKAKRQRDAELAAKNPAGPVTPAPVPGAPAADNPAVVPTDANADPAAPQGSGIQLATEAKAKAAEETDGKASSTVTLGILAGLLLVGTGGWAGSQFAGDLKNKRVKSF